MTDRGIGSWIERRAGISPDRPALIFGDARKGLAVTNQDLLKEKRHRHPH
jgi:hypothetical protein